MYKRQGIWRWALENDLIQPNKRPDELIYLNLLPRERATVQKGGVLFRGMHYLCEMAIEKNWFAKARRNGVWAIDCWFDPNSAAHIWIQDENKEFLRCDLRRSDAKYADYRSDEIYDLLEDVYKRQGDGPAIPTGLETDGREPLRHPERLNRY